MRSGRSSSSAAITAGAGAKSLLDRQAALHPELLVVAHGADERVAPGLQPHGRSRVLAVRDDGRPADLLAALLDHEVVAQGSGVVELDRELHGLAARVDGDLPRVELVLLGGEGQ